MLIITFYTIVWSGMIVQYKSSIPLVKVTRSAICRFKVLLLDERLNQKVDQNITESHLPRQYLNIALLPWQYLEYKIYFPALAYISTRNK